MKTVEYSTSDYEDEQELDEAEEFDESAAADSLLGIKKSESKKKKPQSAIHKMKEVRATSNITAYHDFMKNIIPRMSEKHWDIFGVSNFRNFVKLGPITIDRSTLSYLTRHYDEPSGRFVFPDSSNGNPRLYSFTRDWVCKHTGFRASGVLPKPNRDTANRLWSKYFVRTNWERRFRNSRYYVENLLNDLVSSTDPVDEEDFVLLQIIYQSTMIWWANTKGNAPRELFLYASSVDLLDKICWGELIYRETVESLKHAKKMSLQSRSTVYLNGCGAVLCLWFYELTGIKKYAIINEELPPMTNWVEYGAKGRSFRATALESMAQKVTPQLQEVDLPLYMRTELVEGRGVVAGRLTKQHVGKFLGKRNLEGEMSASPKRRKGMVKSLGGEKNEVKDPKGVPASIQWILERRMKASEEDQRRVKELSPDEQILYWRNLAIMRGKDLDALSRYVGQDKQEYVDEEEGTNEQEVSEEKKEEDVDEEDCGNEEEGGNEDAVNTEENVGVENKEESKEEESKDEPPNVEELDREEKSERGEREDKGNREEEKENQEFEDEKLEADKIIGSVLDDLEGGQTQPVVESSLVRRLRGRSPRKPSRVMTSPSYDIAGAQGGKRRKLTVNRRNREKENMEKSKDTVEVIDEEETPEVLPKSSFVDLKERKKNNAEKRLLTQLNRDVCNRGKFDIRMPNPKFRAFYHNLKIEEFKDEGLLHLNKCLQHFLQVICDSSHVVYVANVASISRMEVLHMLRGGKLDDTTIDTLVNRLKLWMDLPENIDTAKKYGIVSIWINHYFFSGAKEQLDLFNEFIKGHLVQGKSVLLWPIINDEHWHLLEIDIESAKAKHYSSCGHELYDDSCKRIISFVERFSRNAAGAYIQLTYVPVACQQQSMRYDCGILVYLYMKAILQGGPVTDVFPHGKTPTEVRTEISATLLYEGRLQKICGECLDDDDWETYEQATKLLTC